MRQYLLNRTKSRKSSLILNFLLLVTQLAGLQYAVLLSILRKKFVKDITDSQRVKVALYILENKKSHKCDACAVLAKTKTLPYAEDGFGKTTTQYSQELNSNTTLVLLQPYEHLTSMASSPVDSIGVCFDRCRSPKRRLSTQNVENQYFSPFQQIQTPEKCLNNNKPQFEGVRENYADSGPTTSSRKRKYDGSIINDNSHFVYDFYTSFSNSTNKPDPICDRTWETRYLEEVTPRQKNRQSFSIQS
ncbi:hypothetical protein B0O99DRAFT_588073 [Bisporella sp. PMI_857]|nr:hypothetical protein B0O99DRAFT_588073 [Bisporella sp. PMI_857]